MKTKIIIITLAILALISSSGRAAPLGTDFSYQGSLSGASGPLTGSYDITFALHAAASGGVALKTVTNLNVAVSNGLFSTTVDFGPATFTGNALWINLGVRPNGSGAS